MWELKIGEYLIILVSKILGYDCHCSVDIWDFMLREDTLEREVTFAISLYHQYH
jgi:hypothetical protein